MKILIPRDNILCYGVARALGELYGNVEVATVGSIREIVEGAAREADLNLILLDAAMPGMAGFEGIRKTVARFPDVPVLVTAASVDRDDVLLAIRQGARGFHPATMRMDALHHVLSLVLSGEFYIPASVFRDRGADIVMATSLSGVATTDMLLTPRQREVLVLLGTGKSNKEIARQLHLLDGTVKLHVKAILRKLGVNNRTQAVIAAAKAGFLPKELLSRA